MCGSLGDVRYLLVRGQDGQLRAFHNVSAGLGADMDVCVELAGCGRSWHAAQNQPRSINGQLDEPVSLHVAHRRNDNLLRWAGRGIEFEAPCTFASKRWAAMLATCVSLQPASSSPGAAHPLQVCRHHAAAVAQGCGNQTSMRFACPYHGWTYGNTTKAHTHSTYIQMPLALLLNSTCWCCQLCLGTTWSGCT